MLPTEPSDSAGTPTNADVHFVRDIELESDGGGPAPVFLARLADIIGGGPFHLYRRVHRGGVLLMLFGIVYALAGLTPQPQLRVLGTDPQGLYEVSLQRLAVRGAGHSPFIKLQRYRAAGSWYLKQVDPNNPSVIQGTWVGLAPTPPDLLGGSVWSDGNSRTRSMVAVLWSPDAKDATDVNALVNRNEITVTVAARGLSPQLKDVLSNAGLLENVDPAYVWVLHEGRHRQINLLLGSMAYDQINWYKVWLAMGLGAGTVGLFLVIATLALRPPYAPPRGRTKVQRVMTRVGVLILAGVVIALLGQIYSRSITDIVQTGNTALVLLALVGALVMVIGVIWSLRHAQRYAGLRTAMLCLLFPPYAVYHIITRWDYQRSPAIAQLAAVLILMTGIGFAVLARARVEHILDLDAQWRWSLPPQLQTPGLLAGPAAPYPRIPSPPMGKLTLQSLTEMSGDSVIVK